MSGVEIVEFLRARLDEDAEQVRSDAEFIALAREAVPALLAELDRVRAERNEFCDRVDTVNNRAVMHDGVPYLAGRDYADREKALWRITGDEDRDGQPLAFLLPEGAGEPVPLGQVVHDFGPLVLHPEGCTCEQHEDNDSWRRSS